MLKMWAKFNLRSEAEYGCHCAEFHAHRHYMEIIHTEFKQWQQYGHRFTDFPETDAYLTYCAVRTAQTV
jgi:hypothetical protein